MLLCALTMPAAAEDGVITLRTDATFAPIAERLAHDASRRLGRSVVVGELLAEDEVSAGPSVVRLTSVSGRAQLAITSAAQLEHTARLAMVEDEAASIRALVLAVASLVESAHARLGAARKRLDAFLAAAGEETSS